MRKILLSACLAGQPVRFDGADRTMTAPLLSRWRDEGRFVIFCPEVAAGGAVPRPPAEIIGTGGGAGVLDGTARVVEPDGKDVTALFLDGARMALDLARREGCGAAILQARSPSCGQGMIYDGAFAGQLVAGAGVTTALLERHGILVVGPDDLATLEIWVSEPATC